MNKPGTAQKGTPHAVECPPAGLSPYGSRSRPAGGSELYTWLFMRFSGVALLGLALGHLFIMHVFNSIHSIDYDFVAARYIGWFWRGYDGTMLWLALLHGLNGMRIIADDCLRPPLREWVVKGLYIVGFLFWVLGTWVIVAFNPMAVPGTVPVPGTG